MSLTDDQGIDRTALAREVLEVATGSMDFGSGFLSDEEVIALRRFARILGMDPAEATPAEWARGGSGAVKVESEHAAQYTPVWFKDSVVATCLCGWNIDVPFPDVDEPTRQALYAESDQHCDDAASRLRNDLYRAPEYIERRREFKVTHWRQEQALAEAGRAAEEHFQQMLDQARDGDDAPPEEAR